MVGILRWAHDVILWPVRGSSYSPLASSTPASEFASMLNPQIVPQTDQTVKWNSFRTPLGDALPHVASQRASPFFCYQILQPGVVEDRLRQQPLRLRVLFLQRPQSHCVRDRKTSVFPLPSNVRWRSTCRACGTAPSPPHPPKPPVFNARFKTFFKRNHRETAANRQQFPGTQ